MRVTQCAGATTQGAQDKYALTDLRAARSRTAAIFSNWNVGPVFESILYAALRLRMRAWTWKMEPLEVAEHFIERSMQTLSREALAAEFSRGANQLGFRFFACLTHADPANAPPGAVLAHNYPAEWVREVMEHRLYQIDPMLLHAERSPMPFFWNSAELQRNLTDAQREILVRAARHGLQGGYTIPIHLPWSPTSTPASCSVVPDSASVGRQSYLAVQLMATHFYHALTRSYEILEDSPLLPRTNLTRRERQCLELAAAGKSDWAISRILGLSEHTVHRHIELARRRLGVATRVQAIIRALQLRQISINPAMHTQSWSQRSKQSH